MRTSRASALLLVASLLLTLGAVGHAGASAEWPRADWSVSLSNDLRGEVPNASSVTLHVSSAGPDSTPGFVRFTYPDMLVVSTPPPLCVYTAPFTLSCPVTLAPQESKDFVFNVQFGERGSDMMSAVALPGASLGFTVVYSLTDPERGNNFAHRGVFVTDPTAFVYFGVDREIISVVDGDIPEPSLSDAPPVIAVSIPAPDPLAADEIATVRVAVANTDGGTAHGVVLTLSAADVTFLGGDGCTPTGAEDVCPMGDLAPGENKAVNLRLTPHAETTLFGTATADDGATVRGSGLLTIATTADTSHVVATLVGPASLQAGQIGSYTLRLTNNGTGPAENVSVDVSALGGHVVDGGGCTETAAGHLTCTTTEVAVGQVTEHLIRASAPTTGTMTLTATPNAGSGGSATTTITAGSTDLSFSTFSASNTNPHLGDTVTITLAISNLGSVDVNDAYLDSSVPASWNLGDQSRGPCVLTSGNVHCVFGHIGAGQTLTQSLNMVADSIGSVTATGTAGSGVTDTSSANNAKTLTITVTAA